MKYVGRVIREHGSTLARESYTCSERVDLLSSRQYRDQNIRGGHYIDESSISAW